MSDLTPTQQRIMDILADGQPHRPDRLMLAIDSMATIENLRNHLTIIRRKLRCAGEDILAVYHRRKLHYRHVLLLPQEPL